MIELVIFNFFGTDTEPAGDVFPGCALPRPWALICNAFSVTIVPPKIRHVSTSVGAVDAIPFG